MAAEHPQPQLTRMEKNCDEGERNSKDRRNQSTKKRQAADAGRPLLRQSISVSRKKGPSVREKHGINNVNDAVGLVDIRDGDFGYPALFIGQDDGLAHGRGLERAAADGLENGGAVAGLHGFPDVFAGHFAGDHVVRQNLPERVLVFRLERRVNRASWELGESSIRWRKNGERAGALQRFNEPRGLDRGDQRRVIRGIDGVGDDVLCGKHRRAANHGVVLGDDGGADHQYREKEIRKLLHFFKSFQDGMLCPALGNTGIAVDWMSDRVWNDVKGKPSRLCSCEQLVMKN